MHYFSSARGKVDTGLSQKNGGKMLEVANELASPDLFVV